MNIGSLWILYREGGVGNKGQFSSDKRELGLGKNGHSFDTKENLRKKTYTFPNLKIWENKIILPEILQSY